MDIDEGQEMKRQNPSQTKEQISSADVLQGRKKQRNKSVFVRDNTKEIIVIDAAEDECSNETTRPPPVFETHGIIKTTLSTNELIAHLEASLSDDELKQVHNCWATKENGLNTKVRQLSPVTVYVSDLQTLKGRKWLNDKMMDGPLLHLLNSVKESDINQVPPRKICHVSPVVLKAFLDDLSIAGSYKDVDIFSLDTLYLPINVKDCHWTMAIVHLKEKKVCYYDSYWNREGNHEIGQDYLLKIMDLLEAMSLLDSGNNTPFERSSWTTEVMKNIPTQGNGCDCGLYALFFAIYDYFNLPILTTSFNDDLFKTWRIREKICLSLLTGVSLFVL
jgi:Ulp1 family protease